MNNTESTLLLPGHMTYLPLSLAFIEEAAKVHQFSKSDVLKIRLAAEEAVSNVMEHSLQNSMEQFSITCRFNASQFMIVIHEKGKPFSFDEIPEYSPEKLKESGSTAGLGTFMMKKVMDSIQFRNLGREGKELILVKYAAHERVAMPESQQTTDETDGVVSQIRLFRTDDATGIASCAYAVYGYTYLPFIYYPSHIIDLNSQKSLLSCVAVGEAGAIAGHLALRFQENRTTAELATGFVMKGYRNKGVFRQMAELLLKKAEELPTLQTVYIRCPASSPKAQVEAARYGFQPNGVLISHPLVTGRVTAAEGAEQRETVLEMTRMVSPATSPQTVHLPQKYKDVALNILNGIRIPVNVAAPKRPTPLAEPIITVNRSEVLRNAEMYCTNYTTSTADAIKAKVKELCADQTDSIFLHLDMTDPAMPYVAEKCILSGFIFCGVRPFGISGHHALILQYLNNVKVDTSVTDGCSEQTGFLIDFVRKDHTGELPAECVLKDVVVDLDVKIDDEKVSKEVTEIIESDYFQELAARIDELKNS